MKKMIPFMSVRDVVLFPAHPMPLQVGRPFSIASIRKSLLDFEGKLVVTAQRTVEMNDKPDLKQVFQIGCLCKIEEHVEFPDGTMKILVAPQDRIQIKDLQDIDEVRFCSGAQLSEFPKGDEISKEARASVLKLLTQKFEESKSDRFVQSLTGLKEESNSYNFVMRAGHLLCMPKIARRELTVEQMNEGTFLIDTYTTQEKATINLGLARIQEVLEATNSNTAIQKITSLLARR